MTNSKKKSYFFLREDLTYTTNSLLDISNNAIINHKPNSHLTYLMIYNLFNMDRVETILIEKGITFNWIIEKNLKFKEDIIGIIVCDTDFDLEQIFFDSMTLEEYAKNRKEEFYSIKRNKVKK